MTLRRCLGGLLGLALVALAAAGVARAAAPAPLDEGQRVEAVASTLRCPTCQGLSVADSPSGIADSMRAIVSEQLAEGRTPDEVRGWFVDRYGPWILLSPQPTGLGVLVWVLPVVAVTAGGAVAVAAARRRRAAGRTELLNPDTVDGTLADWEAGRLTMPDGPDGDRLESALLLLASVRADLAADHTDSARAETLAAGRVAEALARASAPEPEDCRAGDRPADREATRPHVPTAPTAPARARARVPVGLRCAGIVTAFVVALTGLLSVSTSDRQAGELITGDAPAGDAAAVADEGSAVAAVDRWRAAVDAAPDDAEARTALAEALSDAGSPAEAAEQYREVLARRPDDSRVRLLLASTLLQAGDTAAARTEVDRAIAAAPDDPDALLLLGLVQRQAGQPEADQTLRRFLASAPSGHPGREVATALLGEERAP